MKIKTKNDLENDKKNMYIISLFELHVCKNFFFYKFPINHFKKLDYMKTA